MTFSATVSSLDNRKPEKVSGKITKASKDRRKKRVLTKNLRRRGQHLFFDFWISTVRLRIK
jgi:hypothetical protein